MKHILLRRFKQLPVEYLGTLVVFDESGRVVFHCMTLENFQHGMDEGIYPIVYEYSNRFDCPLWEVKDLPGRSECKIHVANFYSQLRGCIALGDQHTHLNGDGYPDVRNSKKTLERFHDAMGDSISARIEIIDV